MSLKACVWAGRFAPYFEGLPNPQEPVSEDAFLAVFARFADRDHTGEVYPPRKPGWYGDRPKRLLGYIGGEYVIYHQAGFAEMVFAGVEPRIDEFLAACCRELGCQLLDANNWVWVTDIFLGLADRARRHAEQGAAADGGV